MGVQTKYMPAYPGGPGDNCVIAWGEGEATPAGRKGIIFFHGRPGNSTQPFGTLWESYIDMLVARGYCVVSILGGGAYYWGDDQAIAMTKNCMEWMLTPVASGGLGLSGTKIGLHGYSMGGLTVLNVAWRYPTSTPGAVILASAIDLLWFHDSSPVGVTKEMDFTFGYDTVNFKHATVGGITVVNTVSQTINVDGDTAQFAASGNAVMYNTAGVAFQFAYTGKTSTSFTGVTIASGSQSIIDGSVITEFVITSATALTLASAVTITGIGTTTGLAAAPGTAMVEVSNVAGSGRWESVDYTGKTALTLTGCKVTAGGSAFTTASGMRVGKTGQFATNGPAHDPGKTNLSGGPTLAQMRAIRVRAYSAPFTGANADTITGPQTTGIDDLTTLVNTGQSPLPWEYIPITTNPAGEGHTNFFGQIDLRAMADWYDSLTW